MGVLVNVGERIGTLVCVHKGIVGNGLTDGVGLSGWVGFVPGATTGETITCGTGFCNSVSNSSILLSNYDPLRF
jgi:hypothetical protein